MSIVDVIYSYLPAKRKQTPSGWTKFNAVCCPHNGNTPDNRQRGGIIKNGDGVSYHCFNCGYKASYVAGRHLTRKMRNLLSWMGANDDVISKLSIEALKIESDQQYIESISLPDLVDKPLPKDSILLSADTVNDQTIPAIQYVYSRGLTLDDYKFYVSDELKDRIIIPFYYEGRVVGYTARKLTDGKPKYLSEQTPGYVFNLDAQHYSQKYVIVCEGPVDALSIGGVALLGADIMDKQAMFINRLQLTPIVVPDRDKDGQRTVEHAIENKWAVSMPEWGEGVKDVNDAVLKYGKLYTLYLIMKHAEQYDLKIKLRAKQWFLEE